MKERRVFKKGKFVLTRRGNVVINLSKRIVTKLKPYCRRIKVVGSIRRKEKNPIDIDIVLIPKSREKMEERMKKLGRYIQGGEHESTWKVEGVNIELYYTNSEEWGAALLAYSSEFGAGIGLRVIAKKKGFKLNNHGLFKGNQRIAGKTEREIYSALGRSYKEPWER